MPQAQINSVSVTTPIAGKLFVFGHVEGAKITCTPGAAGVQLALYVDSNQVPGTLYTPTPGTPENLSFAAILDGPIPAGSHTVAMKADCFGSGGTTVDKGTILTGNYGVIVLGS